MTIAVNKLNTYQKHSRGTLIQHFQENGTQSTLKLVQSLVELEKVTHQEAFLTHLETQIDTFKKRIDWAESDQDAERYNLIIDVYTKYLELVNKEYQEK